MVKDMVPLQRKASKWFKPLIHRKLFLVWALLILALSGPALSDSHDRMAEPPAAGTAAASPEYERLLAAQRRYERIADAGGWPTIPPGPTIRPGSRDSRVATLARRLVATGDFTGERLAFPEYDEELQAAVHHFQSRHGLEPDMLVGKKTLRAMNIPVTARVAQLRLNAERTRNLFDSPDPDFLFINVPAFEVYLVRNGDTAWKEKVIVGDTETETPRFTAPLTHVVLNPTWTVPRKIASEELLPKIQADADFLTRGGYDVIDAAGQTVDPASIDWSVLHSNNFPFTLVQKPGPINELGLIKFLFPNDYGICMHDTPSRYLFANASRAYSHGCIRVAEPIDFAVELLAADGWTRGRIESDLATGETLTIGLHSPLPVIVTYLTATVDEAGTVHFYRDLYGLDDAASLTANP